MSLGSAKVFAEGRGLGFTSNESINGAKVTCSVDDTIKDIECPIPQGQSIDPNCPPLTQLEDGKCVLEGDTVLTETLLLPSGTTLDCKNHKLTPSVDGQDFSYGWTRYGLPGKPSVPSTPTTAVLLADSATGVTVENCVIENFDFGVVIANSKFPNAVKPETHNLIINNTLNNRYRGVEIIAADGNAICCNKIHSFSGGSGGIGINHDSDDNLVKGNKYVGPSGDPIPGPLFPGGMDEWRQWGWTGAAVRVLGPVFSYNFSVGNRMFVGPMDRKEWAERNTIEDNDIDLPNRIGNALIAESKSDRTTFRNNKIHRASDGISCVGHAAGENPPSRNVLAEGNIIGLDGDDIIGEVEGGILAANTQNPVFRDNTIMNALTGFFLVAQGLDFNGFRGTATVTGNVVKDSEVGLFLLESPGARVSKNDFIGNVLQVEAYLAEPLELSVNGEGNYWGSELGWLESYTNDPSIVTDSYPFLAPVAGSSD